jgi:hypothetical protein
LAGDQGAAGEDAAICRIPGRTLAEAAALNRSSGSGSSVSPPTEMGSEADIIRCTRSVGFWFESRQRRSFKMINREIRPGSADFSTERYCRPHHSVRIEIRLREKSPENGNIWEFGWRLSENSLIGCADWETGDRM